MGNPIRILQFPGTMLYGGVGSVVMNLYRNIDRTKIQFDFCVPRNERGPLDDEIESMGGHIFYIPQMRERGFLNYIKTIKKVVLENGPYKAVHIHSIHMGAVPMIAAKGLNIPAAYHVHNTQDPALDGMFGHKIFESILKSYIKNNATVRLACGEMAGRYIYGDKDFVVLNNAVDLNRFHSFSDERRKEIRTSLGIQDSDIVIGDIARFSPVKNMSRFVQFAEVDKKGSNRLKFLLVGDGEEKTVVETLIQEKSLSNKFILTGSRSDVDVLYNAMDVFCLPSLFEGLPVSLMEAQAVGLPCVISDAVTREGVVGSSKVESVALSELDEDWLRHFYSLSEARITDNDLIRAKFTERKYEICSIAKEVEQIYLTKVCTK